MEYYNDILCVTFEDISDIIQKECFNKLVQRNQVTRVRRGCYGTTALYSVDSFPIRYKEEIYKKFPDIKELAKAKPLLDGIEPDGVALNYYETFKLPDGRYLTDDKIKEYANNAAILNRIKEIFDNATSKRSKLRKGFKNKGEKWEDIVRALPRLQSTMPHSLPENARRLQDKLKQYVKGGYEVLISGKFLNSNANKIKTEAQEAFLATLIADRRNLDNEQIKKIYNMMSEQVLDWEKISASAVAAWRDKLDLITSAGRLGVTKFRNTKTMQVKRTKPTLPLLYWTTDGWDVELLYQKQEENKNGHNVTTYHNRLTVVVVLDPCVNYIVGYAVGTHETPTLIKEAFRNAINHTAELFGQRLKPNQLQSDNYGKSVMPAFYKEITDKYTPAQSKNAKAKIIEPYFKRLNKKYCQFMPNWSGFGMPARKENQPNTEALNKVRHSFPDEEGCRNQIAWIVEQERQAMVAIYKKMYESLPEERKLPLTQEQYLLNFGADTGFTNAVEGQGLRPTIAGIKRDYDCFDIRFREYSHVKWTVKYDPSDLTQVLAMNEDGSLRFMLESKYEQPMALADRKEGDAKELHRIFEFNKQLEQSVTERISLANEQTRELLTSNKELETLSKLILIDSDGQHKDRKSKARLTQADVDSVEVKVVKQRKVKVAVEDESDSRLDLW
jgi:hypothetical protein